MGMFKVMKTPKVVETCRKGPPLNLPKPGNKSTKSTYKR